MPRQRSVEAVASFDPAALRRMRQQQGLSQERLAELIGAYRYEVIRYEKGHSLPGMDTFRALAEALEVSDPLELTTVTRRTATLADLRARGGITKADLVAASTSPG